MKTRRGFTLIELLIAMLLAVMVMIGVFMIFQRSSRGFEVHQQSIRLYDNVRAGLTHLKNDIKKAAFLSTPNSALDNNACQTPATLRAFSIAPSVVDASDDTSVALYTSNRNIQPLSITMLGPYATTRVFRTQSMSVGTGQQLSLLQTDTASLTANYPGSQAEFDALFTAGRLLKVVNRDQYELYFTIRAADFGSATITLEEPVVRATANNPCGFYSDGSLLEVVVLSFVRYRIAVDDRPGAPANKTDLIREEMRLLGGNPSPVDGTDLHLASYAVDLMLYDFIFDVGAPGNPDLRHYPTYNDGAVLVGNGFGNGLLEWGPNATTEDLRFVTIKLSVRTAREDGGLTFSPRANLFGPLRRFEADNFMLGAARVESMATRVELATFGEKAL